MTGPGYSDRNMDCLRLRVVKDVKQLRSGHERRAVLHRMVHHMALPGDMGQLVEALHRNRVRECGMQKESL